CGSLHSLANEAVRQSRHGVWLEKHRRHPEQKSSRDAWPRRVTADPQRDLRLELAEDAATGEEAGGDVEQGLEACGEGYVLKRADMNETKREAGFRNEPHFQAALCAYEENLGRVACDQLPCHGERRNDMATGASAGDKNPQYQAVPLPLSLADSGGRFLEGAQPVNRNQQPQKSPSAEADGPLTQIASNYR